MKIMFRFKLTCAFALAALAGALITAPAQAKPAAIVQAPFGTLSNG